MEQNQSNYKNENFQNIINSEINNLEKFCFSDFSKYINQCILYYEKFYKDFNSNDNKKKIFLDSFLSIIKFIFYKFNFLLNLKKKN